MRGRSVTTLPTRMAIPFGVINPSLRLKVPRPEAYAACRYDQVEARPTLEERRRRKWGEFMGATARYPFFFNKATT